MIYVIALLPPKYFSCSSCNPFPSFLVSRADLVDQASSAEKSFDEFLMETRYAMSLENATSTKKRFSHSIEMEQTKLKVDF